MQKDLTEVKIFQNILGGYFFSETPCRYISNTKEKMFPSCYRQVGQVCHLRNG